MKSAKIFIAAAFVVVPILTAAVAFTQEDSNFKSRELNFREYAKLMRENVKAERRDIIKQLMQFDGDDAAKFWPIFDQYDAELTKIGESRTDLLVEYAKNYDNLTDDDADQIMSKALDLEAQRAVLKKKHFDIMKKSIGATQAAKFFQIENQMQHIIDLQISADLPAVPANAK